MVKAKKSKKKTATSTTSITATTMISTTTATVSGSYSLHRDETGALNPSSPMTTSTNTTTTHTTGTTGTVTGGGSSNSVSGGGGGTSVNSKSKATSNNSSKKKENLDDLNWLRECELRQTASGEPYLQLEYQNDDELIVLLHKFLDESSAGKDIIDAIYQIWQQTVLSTLLQSSAVWKKDTVTASDQRYMKDTLKTARYKIHFILHHVTGSILTATAKKWIAIRNCALDMCYHTLQLVPRLAESCPHHATDIRLAIIHFEGKEFLAVVACETWDALYDFAVPIQPRRFIPVLRRCAMLDILDKDWNMLGGWEDILKGIETKCCGGGGSIGGGIGKTSSTQIHRLQSDAVLHETTTVLRNARNSMQCKFFSVRFMRYTEDQAPQRWRYFPKCSAPACANIETPDHPHRFRCTKCWYFHYCSASCQEYCDNIMGLHPKFCKDTPASKAALCQKETEQYLGWTNGTYMNTGHTNTNNAAAGTTTTALSSSSIGADMDVNNPMLCRVSCQACGTLEDLVDSTAATKLATDASTSELVSSSLTKIKRCIQCQTVTYCSRQCQEWDWRVGGHREVCKALNGSSSDGTTKQTPTTNAVNNKSSLPAALNNSNSSSGNARNGNHANSSTSNNNLVVVKDLN